MYKTELCIIKYIFQCFKHYIVKVGHTVSPAVVWRQNKLFVPLKLKWNLQPCWSIYFYEGKGLQRPFSPNEVLPALPHSSLSCRYSLLAIIVGHISLKGFQWRPCKLCSSAPRLLLFLSKARRPSTVHRKDLTRTLCLLISSPSFNFPLFRLPLLVFSASLINSQPAAICVREREQRIKSRKQEELQWQRAHELRACQSAVMGLVYVGTFNKKALLLSLQLMWVSI